MAKKMLVGVNVVVTEDTEITYNVDALNDDATFTLIGADGLEPYLTLDEDSLARFQEMAGSALHEIRTAEHDND